MTWRISSIGNRYEVWYEETEQEAKTRVLREAILQAQLEVEFEEVLKRKIQQWFQEQRRIEVFFEHIDGYIEKVIIFVRRVWCGGRIMMGVT